MREKERILNILITLPRIRIRIANNGKWDDIKDLCSPLGLNDTAFRDNPSLKDYLMDYYYWEKKLGIIKSKKASLK